MLSFGLRWFRKKQPTLPVWVLSSRCNSASCLDRGTMCGPRISYAQPELAILSMYCIAEKPVIRDGQIIIQECMNLMLSADHRVIDGDMACAFLDRICEILENPYAFMN